MRKILYRLRTWKCRMLEVIPRPLYPDKNLLDEINLARADECCRKAVKAYVKTNLLILDDWLLKESLSSQEIYDHLEVVESRTKHSARIFCTQYETDDWYSHLNPTPAEGSQVTDVIMDRIAHNAYIVPLEGKSMRERHGLTTAQKSGAEV